MSKEEQFELFGYESDEKCVVCESIDTRSEPRFGYSVCIKHFEIPPVKLQNQNKEDE
tara:strand:+ start:567 stop:737 length:171 start_codon:yes stop_codon:yes gene_type:complete